MSGINGTLEIGSSPNHRTHEESRPIELCSQARLPNPSRQQGGRNDVDTTMETVEYLVRVKFQRTSVPETHAPCGLRDFANPARSRRRPEISVHDGITPPPTHTLEPPDDELSLFIGRDLETEPLPNGSLNEPGLSSQGSHRASTTEAECCNSIKANHEQAAASSGVGPSRSEPESWVPIKGAIGR